MMLKIRMRQIYLFFLGILFFSCQGQTENNVQLVPLEVKIERFDQAFAQLQGPLVKEQDDVWQKSYGVFYADFIPKMLGLDPSYPARWDQLAEVAQNPDFAALKKEVQRVFPDLQAEERALGEALARFQGFFPDQPLPKRFIAFFSGFQTQIPVGEDYVGIGLDLFLGADAPFYPALQFQIPRYISRRFTPENLVPRVMEGIIHDFWTESSQAEGTFLHQMIEAGKKLYILEQTLPQSPDSLLIGYTAAQMAWAEQYEKLTWDWFVHQELLYETDFLRYQKYLNEAPFTAELGQNNDSAPKLGVFIGWKMVKHYHKRHANLSLQELIAQKDAQSFLHQSGYRGKSN
jgi:hypothetical protein